MKIDNERLSAIGLNFETGQEAILYLQNLLEWLESHNKNYNQEQYYKILDCLEIVKSMEEK